MRRAIAFAVLACVLAVPAARAQGGLTPEARQAILDYQLTLPRANHLIIAMEAMSTYLLSLPDHQERMAKAAKMTPAERRAQVEKDPRAAAILKENDLTAPEYLVGVPALRMALLVAQGMPTGANIAASPANVAFAKANLAQLKAKMDAADGAARPPK
jgi:hypothetical protein